MTPIRCIDRSQSAVRSWRRGGRKRLRGFERLEDRALLAAFMVNSLLDTVDANPGDEIAQDAAGQTTLRAAIMEANALAGNDTINLPAGTYMLTLAGHSEDTSATGDLDISGVETLTIVGAGAGATIVDAGGLGQIGDRIFHVLSGANFSVSGVTIRNGRVVRAPAGHGIGDGGGIFNAGTLTITNSTVSGNVAFNFGGGIHNAAGAMLTISDSTITGNRGQQDTAPANHKGGGVYNSGTLTMINCTVFANFAGGGTLLGMAFGFGEGGGLYNSASGNATVASTTISQNSVGGSPDLSGGGIYNSGTLAITSSTVSGNSAVAPVPGSMNLGSVAGDGGGIYNDSSTMSVTNTTISGNRAAFGGAIHNRGQMTIKSSTIASNSAPGPRFGLGGPGGVVNGGTLTLQNTIIAQNDSTGFVRDFAGTAVSLGNNLIGHKASSTGWIESDKLDTDPRLGPLADNGGPTMTQPLLPDSPAIDAGNNTGAPSTDQRGNRRPRDGNGDGIALVDIGAFEFALGQAGIEAAHDNATVNEDTTNNIIPVLANDVGPAGRILIVAAVTQPAHGSASVSSNGGNVLYTPNPNFVGIDTFAYTVSDGSGAATAMVTVTVINVDTDLQGTAGDDVFLVRRDAGGANVQVFGNDTATGTPLLSMPVGSSSLLLIDTLGGDDRLIMDLVNGNPIPTGGVQFAGGDHGAAGDRLVVRDGGTANGTYIAHSTTPGDGTVTVGGRNIALAGVEPLYVSGLNSLSVVTPNAKDVLMLSTPAAGMMQLAGTSGAVALSPVIATNIGSFIIDAASNDGASGSDSLTVTADGVVPGGFGFVQYRSGRGENTLAINGGTARLDATVETGGTLSTTVAGAARLITHRVRQTSLTLDSGSRATILPDGTPAATSVLNVLTIEEGATLDINDNALIVDYTGDSPAATIRQRIASGRGGVGVGQGRWNGTGITSTTAQQANATEPDARSAGYAENATLPLGPYTSFRGQAVDDTAVLSAYTRTADANLDGVVNDDDVTIVGATYAPGKPQPRWALGDFDYNGFVDDDDVTLLGALYNPSAAPLAPSPPPAPVMPADNNSKAAADALVQFFSSLGDDKTDGRDWLRDRRVLLAAMSAGVVWDVEDETVVKRLT
ncbi:MAG: choice-of-anchor Q domain-containing protein [Pirellulales bacterium]